jgi:short subunit dehydrogenase-like uncharacterized protein
MIHMKNKILIYGASGYTAKLLAKVASERQLNFVLGGRSNFETKFTYRKFSLEIPSEIDNQLGDIKLLINLAGPFSKTNKALIEACVRTKTHYTDIAGEYSEFKTAFEYNQQAIAAGIMLMPGTGFGVVPTNIAAKLAQEKLPDATHLTIGFITQGGVSRGTLNTVLKDIHTSGIKVKDGNEILAMPASSKFDFNYKNKNHKLVYNPWRADLYTSSLDTGIKNIETYSNFPQLIVKMMQGKFLWLRDFLLTTAIKWLPEGPNDKQLNNGSTLLVARVSNAKKEVKEIIIEGPEAYVFTIEMLLAISKQIVENNFVAGFQTPSIYGKELLNNINKVKIN